MTKKNILFFFTDQQRKDTLGCYGNNICKTPNLDQLAREGTVFNHAYTPTAICTPARASLLTGMKPTKHNLLANYERNVGFEEELDEKKIPFSHYLKENGYQVGNVGKWHIGKTKGPEDHGFEGIFYPGWGEPVHHPDYVKYLDERNLPHFKVRNEIRGTFPNGKPGNIIGGILEQPKEAAFTYYLAERTIEKLHEYAAYYRESNTPFYLSMNIFGPHLPYYLPEEYANMYDPEQVKLPAGFLETFKNKPTVQRNYSEHWCYDSFNEKEWKKIIAMYWGYTTLIDEQIGRVLDVLQELGLDQETLILFSTDHGSFVGSHKMSDKGPAMYEDIYNIPLVAKYPGMGQGNTEQRFVSLLDVTATIVDCGCGFVPSHFDGRSLLGLLRNEPPKEWREEICAEFHGHHFPYPQRMIRSEKYKLIVNPADINEFYDLENDPAELKNLIDQAEYKEIINEHYRKLFQYLKVSGDNFYHWMDTMYEVGSDATH